MRYFRHLSVASTALMLCCLACTRDRVDEPVLVETHSSSSQPSILLVTLDTTRADALGVDSGLSATPHLDDLARQGRWFSLAQTTAPMTLPAHVSLMTGSYPGDHGIHENARYLGSEQELLAERLRAAGYRTAAFVSGFPLSQQFGLARGFDHYDDSLGEGDEASSSAQERSASATTEKALAYLDRTGEKPLFLWVHYFDPHEPYVPPEPFRTRYADNAYLGEVAFMDEQIGRLIDRFRGNSTSSKKQIVVVGDHGEGLGDHGEALHGNLLYQGVMRVPLILAGDGVTSGRTDHAVSTRRVFHTIAAWAGVPQADEPTLLNVPVEPVLGEAMKPFLQYGWQPQVMAVQNHLKVIRSGETEAYDLAADPLEQSNFGTSVDLSADLRKALREYPIPNADTTTTDSQALSDEDRDRLASLGYASGGSRAPLRENAPNPKDMAHLFESLDFGSGLFVRKRYEETIPVFQDVLAEDPENLMVSLRLAVAHSVLGQKEKAEDYFRKARNLDPSSIDVMHYHGLHYLRSGNLASAEPLLRAVISKSPGRVPAIEALAELSERAGDPVEAESFLERLITLSGDSSRRLVRLGDARMAQQKTVSAVEAYERARAMAPDSFERFLELGVLYLASGDPKAAGQALDQVSSQHPGYAMALFKRAQVSVLLGEPDRVERIRRAIESADVNTRNLIESEPLFRDYQGRLVEVGL